METVLLPVVVSLLVVLGGLAFVGWMGVRLAPRGVRPVPAPIDDGRSLQATRDATAIVAVALARADGIAGPGRHDERRCAF